MGWLEGDPKRHMEGNWHGREVGGWLAAGMGKLHKRNSSEGLRTTNMCTLPTVTLIAIFAEFLLHFVVLRTFIADAAEAREGELTCLRL